MHFPSHEKKTSCTLIQLMLVFLFLAPVSVICIGKEAASSPDLKSAFWPAEWRDGTSYMLPGKNNELFLFFKAGEKKDCNIKIHMALPSEFSLVAVGDFYSHQEPGPLMPVKISENMIQKEGKEYRQYSIELSKGTVLPYWIFQKSVSIVVRPAKEVRGDFKIYWNLEWDNGSTGKEKVLKTSIAELPQAAASPKSIMLMPIRWLGMSSALPGTNINIDDSWADFLEGTGANAFAYSGTSRNSLIDSMRKKHIPFALHPAHLMLGKPDDKLQNWAINQTGDKMKETISPIYIMKNRNGMDNYTERIKKYSSPSDMIVIDHEPPNSMTYSFDEETIRLFCKTENIPPDSMTAAKILESHKNAWIKFRCWQNAEILKCFADSLHATGQDKKFIVAAQIMFPEKSLMTDLERTGVDIREVDKITEVDGHAPMTYEKDVKKYLADVRRTVLAVKKPVYPIMLYQMQYIPTEYAGYLSPLGAKRGRLQVVGAIAEGAAGIMVWPREGMDGLDWSYFAKAANELAILEQFFKNGKRLEDYCRIEGLPEKEYDIEIPGEKLHIRTPSWKNDLISRSFELNDKILNVIFNLSPFNECYCKLYFSKLEENKYVLTNPVENITLIKSQEQTYFTNTELMQGIFCKLAEEDIAYWILKKYEPGKITGKFIYESQIKKEYETIYKKNDPLQKNITKGNIEIKWGDIDKDNSPDLEIKNDAQTVGISLSGGRIMRWDFNDKNQDMVKWDFEYGGLFMDIFGNSAWNGEEKAEYKVISKNIADKNVTIVLERKLESPGLRNIRIRKTVTVGPESITVKYNIKNESDLSKEILLGIHNTFDLGKSNIPGDDSKILLNQGIVVPLENAPKIFSGSKNISCSGKEMTADWIACSDTRNGEAIMIKIDHAALKSVSSWRGGAPTCEWQYNPIVLKSGDEWETECLLARTSDLAAYGIR